MVRVKSDSADRLFQQHDSVCCRGDGCRQTHSPAGFGDRIGPRRTILRHSIWRRFFPGRLRWKSTWGVATERFSSRWRRNIRSAISWESRGSLGRVQRACGRASRHAVSNVRVLRVETSYAVKYLLPPGSTAVAHLLFPDPWPKKRHERRRIVTKDFLAAVHRLLAPERMFSHRDGPGGLFHRHARVGYWLGFRRRSQEDQRKCFP